MNQPGPNVLTDLFRRAGLVDQELILRNTIITSCIKIADMRYEIPFQGLLCILKSLISPLEHVFTSVTVLVKS